MAEGKRPLVAPLVVVTAAASEGDSAVRPGVGDSDSG